MIIQCIYIHYMFNHIQSLKLGIALQDGPSRRINYVKYTPHTPVTWNRSAMEGGGGQRLTAFE